MVPTILKNFDSYYALKKHISREMMHSGDEDSENDVTESEDSESEETQWALELFNGDVESKEAQWPLEGLLKGEYDPDEESEVEHDVGGLEDYALIESTLPQDFALAQPYSWVPLGDVLRSARCSTYPSILYRLLDEMLRECATGTPRPELLSFASSAFRMDMHKWIADSLGELGYFLAEPSKMNVFRSTDEQLFLLGVAECGSSFFCKALHFSVNEAAITAMVSQLFPDLVVRPLSVSVRQNIILKFSRKFGKTCYHECSDTECQTSACTFEKECRKKAMEATTSIHVQPLRLMPELQRSGLFSNTRIDMMRKDYSLFIKHLRQHSLVSDETFQKLEAISAKVETLCDEVELAGIPSVLCHGDLGLHNLTCAQGGGKKRLIFDWGEATISHPFFDIEIAYGHQEVDVSCFSSWSKYCDKDTALRGYCAVQVLVGFWDVYRRLWPSIAVKSFLLSRAKRAEILEDISYFLREADAWTVSNEHSQGKGGTSKRG